MRTFETIESAHDREHLNVWFCGGCDSVHLTAGGMRLSFTQSEYDAFTKMVVETYYNGWPRVAQRTFAADHVDIEAMETTVAIDLVH